MISIIDAGQVALSNKEKVFHAAGFDCYPKDEGQVCFRQFFKVKNLQPILMSRLKRDGVQPTDEISLCYSESDNLVSASVMTRDVFIEYEADSREGINLLWGFGIDL